MKTSGVGSDGVESKHSTNVGLDRWPHFVGVSPALAVGTKVGAVKF